MQGRTYSKRVSVEPEPAKPSNGVVSVEAVSIFSTGPQYEQRHYVDTGAGYSVTDGVVITAKRRD